ncbi:MAG: hypothetical protein ABIJ96_15890 [Elusimicrobiota bacterium]
MNKTHIFTTELCGLRLGFQVDGKQLRETLRTRYRLFLAKRKPHYMIKVETTRPAADRQVQPFRPTIKSNNKSFRFHRGDAQLLLMRKSRLGILRIWPNVYSFDAALRVIYAGLLAARRPSCLFLHAAAVANSGKALVFPGKSGAGKTTLGRRLGRRTLGDELIGIRRRRNGFDAFSTPFWGNGRKPSRRVSGRIMGLCFLGRKGTDAMRPLSAADAQREALKCLLWFPGQSDRDLARAWTVILDLVKKAPAYRFSFNKKTSLWPRLREVLGK